jgi:TRAM domain
MGRTECNRIVNFEGPARLIHQLVDVRITEARPHSMRAQVVEADAGAVHLDSAVDCPPPLATPHQTPHQH